MRPNDPYESLTARARRSSDPAPAELGSSPATIVVGAGAAGTLAAIHLLSRPDRKRVIVVERSCRVGRGLAYATTNPAHLLNVQAGRMSISSGAPHHFVSWLRHRMAEVGEDSFVPRMLYGDYLAHALAAAAADGDGALRTVIGEATSLSVDGDRVHVGLADGRRLVGSEAILALGNPPPANPPLATPEFFTSGRYIPSPWTDSGLDGVESGEIVLIGSGLTAIDVALTLADRPVRIHAISRHGLLPQTHRSPASTPVQPAVDPRIGLTHLLHALRAASAEVNDWRAVLDGLRPRTQRIWQALTTEEQARLLRHAAPYWNTHRHRIPPEVAARIAALRESGKLTLRAATVTTVCDRATAAHIRITLRRSGETETIDAAHVINCSGPRLRLFDDPPALLGDLVSSGLARPDTHGIGLDTTENGNLIRRHGASSPHLYTLGSLRRGTLWESTAIPELRAQAERLAAEIPASAAPPAPAPTRGAARRRRHEHVASVGCRLPDSR